MGGRVHVEVGFGGEPVVGDFVGYGGDEAEKGVGVWEERGDAGSAADLFVEVFKEVGSAEAQAVFGWQEEDGEGFGDVGFEPGGEVRSGVLVLLGEGAEFGVRLGARA